MLTTCKWFQINLDKELILCTVFRTNFVYSYFFKNWEVYNHNPITTYTYSRMGLFTSEFQSDDILYVIFQKCWILGFEISVPLF